MSAQAQTSFLQRLAEAATWCEYLLTQKNLKTLRYPDLVPPLIFQDLVSLTDQEHYVINVIRSRRALLKECSLELLKPEEILNKGKLLFCYPNQLQSDGVFNYVTGGYFDGYDLPPIDTWICFGKYARRKVLDQASWHAGLLICWVPDRYIKMVSRIIKPESHKEVSWGDHFEWVGNEQGFLSAISRAK